MNTRSHPGEQTGGGVASAHNFKSTSVTLNASGRQQLGALQPPGGRNIGKATFTSKDDENFTAAQVYNTLNKNSDYNALAQSSYISPAQQKKTKGFVDFDLQLFRPDGTQNATVHEKRFEPYNYFPANISNNKPIRNVDFAKILARDGKMYSNVQLSDSLFEPDRHLNLVKAKDVGILQFSKVGDNRGDLEKRLAKLKEYKVTNRDDAIFELLRDTDRKRELRRRRPEKAVLENDKSVALAKQYSRVNAKSSHLPVHMQNNNARVALNQGVYQSLKANNFRERPFLDPISTLNSRKDFSAAALKKKALSANKPLSQPLKTKKKNLTFNQLLSKFGYI